MDLATLRRQHPALHYTSYDWSVNADGLKLEFEFRLEPDIVFHPTLELLGVTSGHLTQIDPQLLEYYIFHIGLIESFSYWKAAAPAHLVIEAGELDDSARVWWQELLLKGMGEFLYVNKIDFTAADFVSIDNGSKKLDQKRFYSVKSIKEYQSINRDINLSNTAKIMIPLGGGKDSAVTLSLLQKHLPAVQLGTMVMSAHEAAYQLALQSGLPLIQVKRTLDPQLQSLNRQGYLNGHTPFSALLAWVTSFTALLFDYQVVAVSNERSSNEGNVEFQGIEINHQYSKTFEFETAFQTYQARYAPTAHPQYFSLLRPLYELQIGQLFAAMPEYHALFRSCNRGKKTNSWCGECSKCLFAALILSPFLAPQAVQAIFGKDILNDGSLLPLLRELIGAAPQKPLECIGTRDESLVAAYLTKQQYERYDLPLPALLTAIDQDYLTATDALDTKTQEILGAWNHENQVPAKIADWLQAMLEETAYEI